MDVSTKTVVAILIVLAVAIVLVLGAKVYADSNVTVSKDKTNELWEKME